MTQKSVKRQLGSMILAFEAFVVFFGTLVAFGLKIAEPQLVWGFGLAFSAVLILTPGYLGRKGSYIFAWALQVLLLVVSFFIPWMLIIAIIFVGLFGWAMIAGATIDLARKAKANVDTFEIPIEKDN
jgi:predicted membrane protein